MFPGTSLILGPGDPTDAILIVSLEKVGGGWSRWSVLRAGMALGRAQTAQGIMCWFGFCFKAWQSISVLALSASTGSWSPLHVTSTRNNTSNKADKNKMFWPTLRDSLQLHSSWGRAKLKALGLGSPNGKSEIQENPLCQTLTQHHRQQGGFGLLFANLQCVSFKNAETFFKSNLMWSDSRREFLV